MESIQTPAFVVDTDLLEENLKILADLKQQADCKIVLALKAFALWHTFPLIGKYLDGCSASGIHEARLSQEEMGKHTLVYSPGYQSGELDKLLEFASHLNFNSASQWQHFKTTVLSHPRYKSGDLQVGIRINPEHSTGKVPHYDPCGPHSRLGASKKSIRGMDFEGISGLHFHTLCEQYTDDLESTLEAIDHRFADILMKPHITWLNLGGGHWITKPDYDRDKLVALIKKTKERYNLEEIWLEPGEAIAIHTGTLEASVLDIVCNGKHKIAVLDVSPTAHMPDTLEMPYQPDVHLTDDNPNTTNEEISEWQYFLGGASCLAGDFLGPYTFSRKLSIGDRLTFEDMAHYTMVKTTTFNGVPHPSIVLKSGDSYTKVRDFTYEDFKGRLG